MYRLKVEKGDSPGKLFDLDEGEVLAGRSRACAVRLKAPDISGTHLRLTVAGSKVTAENLSRYGTSVDGVAISIPTELKAGQRVHLGGETVLLLEDVPDAMRSPAGGEKSEESFPSRTYVTEERKTPAEESDTGGTGAGEALSAAASPKTGKVPPEAEAPATGAGVPEPAEQETGEGGPEAAAEAEPATGAVESGIQEKTSVSSKDIATGEALSQGSWAEPGTADDRTRAMQTRIAGRDEIEFLRVMDQRRAKTRMIMIGLGVLGLLLVCGFLLSLRPKPETFFTWPVDAAGEYLEGYAEAPLGGYELLYPKSPGAKVTPSSQGLTVTCSIGRNFDVPMRVVLEELVDDRFVRETLEESIQYWKTQAVADNAKWNFDAVLPVTHFIGVERGIRFKVVPYQREQEGSWYGMASVFRSGRRLIVTRVEVPAAERARAEEFLFTAYAAPNIEFVRSHWEGGPEIPQAVSAELLSRARGELRRLAPATWESVEKQLVGALRKAALEGNEAQEAEALSLLVSLREKKTLWFNEQRCQKEAAVAQGDERRLRQIAQMCKGVFSDMEDQRFFEVRKW